MRYIKREEGATIIEYAIVAPILFLLVMGIIEFALIMYAQSVLDSATTHSARFGTTFGDYTAETGVNPDRIADRNAFLISNIKRRAKGLLNEDNINVDVESFGGCGQSSIYTATYRWEVFTPMIQKFVSTSPCSGGDAAEGVYHVCSAIFVTNEPCN